MQLLLSALFLKWCHIFFCWKFVVISAISFCYVYWYDVRDEIISVEFSFALLVSCYGFSKMSLTDFAALLKFGCVLVTLLNVGSMVQVVSGECWEMVREKNETVGMEAEVGWKVGADWAGPGVVCRMYYCIECWTTVTNGNGNGRPRVARRPSPITVV